MDESAAEPPPPQARVWRKHRGRVFPLRNPLPLDRDLRLCDQNFVDWAGSRTIDIHVNVGLTLHDLHAGCSKAIEYRRLAPCARCDAAGFCGREPLCPHCSGRCYRMQDAVAQVAVAPGSFEGTRVVLAGHSHAWHGVDCGSLVVSFYELPDARFTRNRSDVCHFRPVARAAFARGFSAHVDSPTATVTVERRPGPGEGAGGAPAPVVWALVIRHQGLPDPCAGGAARGDLVVVFYLKDQLADPDPGAAIAEGESVAHWARRLLAQSAVDPRTRKRTSATFRVLDRTGAELPFDYLA